jgi:hypothetical protein
VAAFVWLSMLLAPVLFAGATAAAPSRPEMPQLEGLFRWLAAAVAGLGIVMSRVVPPRIGPRGPGVSREATAFTRLVLAWAILEGAALFPMAARLVTGDPWLFLVLAVVLVALASVYPGERLWASLASQPLPSSGRSGPMVR